MRPASTASRALAARTYLLRAPRRVIPVALVQALVTALLVAVITPLNVFDSAVEVYIEPLRYMTIVTPQMRNDFDEALTAQLDANPHQESRTPAKMLWIDTPSIIGELSSPVLAMSVEAREALMDRVGLRLVRGKLPTERSPGAALHEDVLRARGMDIGDPFGRMVDPNDMTPGYFEVVGVLAGGPRLGLVDLGYASIPDFVLARRPGFQVIYAADADKAASDAYLRGCRDEKDRPVFRVVDEQWARKESATQLKNLPLIVGFITGAVAVIVALVTSLLNVITFQSRTDEFALYLAVGHPRRRLVRKLAVETTATALLGWLGGLVLGIATVTLYDRLFLDPKAIEMQVLDAQPLLFSLMVPVLSTLVSASVLAIRLHRMDPVSVIQRRGG